jgi:hypothetical protein
MTEVTLLPFDLPAVQRKKLTVDFEGGCQSSDGGLLLLREAERSVGICARLANSVTDRRDPGRVHHQLVELIKTRALAICCGYTRTATISTGWKGTHSRSWRSAAVPRAAPTCAHSRP